MPRDPLAPHPASQFLTLFHAAMSGRRGDETTAFRDALDGFLTPDRLDAAKVAFWRRQPVGSQSHCMGDAIRALFGCDAPPVPDDPAEARAAAVFAEPSA